MKICLIMNPTAKSGKGKKKWNVIYDHLNKYRIEFETKISEYSGHAIKLSYEISISTKFEVVVAVGGDGTINEVLQGIAQCQSETGNSPSLGILYTGTSPDICKFHNIPLETEKAVRILKDGHGVNIDIGRIEHIKNGITKTSWFLCSVNLGIGAQVAAGSNTGLRKYLGDTLGTLISLICSTIKHQNSDFNAVVDNSDIVLEKCLNVTIGKNPYIASGIKVDIEIKPDDGKMYLFSINNINILSLLFKLPSLYRGDFHQNPKNRFLFLKEFECRKNNKSNQVEYDGDPQGTLPCKISLENNFIRMIK